MLGPLYQYKSNEDEYYQRFLFFSYKDKPKQDMSRFSVLGGLFEYKQDQGEKGIKILYIPLHGRKKKVKQNRKSFHHYNYSNIVCSLQKYKSVAKFY